MLFPLTSPSYCDQAQVAPILLPALQLKNNSLASLALQAHGVEQAPAVVVHNYTSAYDVGGRALPFHVAPTPRLDFPMCFLPVTSARAGETIMTLPLAPGMESYLRQQGILHAHTNVLEVNPGELRAGKLGYPTTDVLTQYLAHGSCSGATPPHGAYLVQTFPSSLNRQQALQAGLLPLQQSDSHQTNNKALLHRVATEVAFLWRRFYIWIIPRT